MVSSGMLRRVALVNVPEDTILHSHRRENLKFYKVIFDSKYKGLPSTNSELVQTLLSSRSCSHVNFVNDMNTNFTTMHTRLWSKNTVLWNAFTAVSIIDSTVTQLWNPIALMKPEGGEVVSLKYRPRFTPNEEFWPSILLEAE
jgi:hypothetical protein